jgi:hypothetical protein
MPNEFVARNGVIALNNSTVTGSLNVTNGITGSFTGSLTGSLFGTSSWAVSASNAVSAAWAPGSAATGDKITSGSVTASVDIAGTTFRLISGSSTFLYVSSSGNVGISTATPSAQFEIKKSAQSVPNIVLSGPNNFNAGDFKGLGITNYYSDVTTTNKQLAIYNTDNTNYPYFRVAISNLNYVSVDVITGSTAGAKDLYVNNTIYITSGSNVGIGTLIPTAKLQVSGTINVVNFRGSGSLATASIFTVDGAAGRLFSVNDSLSGSLFSVNTIAGLPVIEVFSDNTVRIGQYGQKALFVSQSRVGIGKETALNANLDISGSAIITGSLNVTGSITTVGTITATTLVVQTITSSIEYSSGSNIFGSKSTDTQQFTGSVGITGSLTSNGNTVVTGSFTIISGSTVDFQVTDGGTKQGNAITDTHNITGSVNISGSTTITGSLGVNSGNLSIPKALGNTIPTFFTGSALGTSTPGISFTGSDVAGFVTVRTGATTPAANATIFAVSFSSAYPSPPYVVTQPGNYSSSLAIGGISGTFVTTSTTGFSMFTGPVALKPSVTYSFYYLVVG